MAIITQSDIAARITPREVVRLTDDANLGTVDVTVLNGAIAEGEAEIMNDIAQKYATPLTLSDATTVTAVKAKLLDCICYRLYMRRSPIPEEINEAYLRAIAWAKSIATGERGLVGESLAADTPGTAGDFHVNANAQTFGHDNMSGL